MKQKILLFFWGMIIFLGACFLILCLLTDITQLIPIHNTSSHVIWLMIFILAFSAEYIDSSLGMGYGTTLTPILLLFGFPPLSIVPAILFSEFITGVTAGFLHHKHNNVNLKKGSKDFNVMLALSVCSILGTIIAVPIALNIPTFWLKLYIGILVFGIGLFILWTRNHKRNFSWKKIIALGIFAAFNKGMSGGGYGPVTTGGQILSGVNPKNAIGITSLAEGITCLVGLILYFVFQGGLEWTLAFPLAAGALISVPFATLTIKFLPHHSLKNAIGLATLFLGSVTLIKIMF